MPVCISVVPLKIRTTSWSRWRSSTDMWSCWTSILEVWVSLLSSMKEQEYYVVLVGRESALIRRCLLRCVSWTSSSTLRRPTLFWMSSSSAEKLRRRLRRTCWRPSSKPTCCRRCVVECQLIHRVFFCPFKITEHWSTYVFKILYCLRNYFIL